MRNCLGIIVAGLAAVASSAAHAGDQRNIGVGSELTFHDAPYLNANNYGCYDLGNTQQLEQMRYGISGGSQLDQIDRHALRRGPRL